MASTSASSSHGNGSNESVDFKLPYWDGDWATYTDYVLRVELRADATKPEDLPTLGPRLAANLVGRAFESILDVDRAELKKSTGWRYLLEFLEKKRGREKVDVLGDSFTDFFLKKDVHRREGESLSDYEPRFRQLIRRLEKAMVESGAEGQIPTELYGWFLINVYMKLDASDAANVKGRAETYKLEDVFGALKKMWSGGSLSVRDQEKKRRKEGQAMLIEEHEVVSEEQPSAHIHLAEDGPGVEEDEELEEATAYYQETLEAMLEEPEDGSILASFRDARKALDKARVSRGFYPVRNPNVRSNYGKSTGKGQSSDVPRDYADKICMRCGKKGHIARICPQKKRDGGAGVPSSHSKIGYVGVNFSGTEMVLEVQEDQKEEENGWEEKASAYAIIDSGASDNIIGVDTLQDVADQLEHFHFDPSQDIQTDFEFHKQFTYGNNLSSAALGRAFVTVGVFGHLLELEVHIVEGPTPFLLSSKFLAEMDAVIDFRKGTTAFRKLSEQQYQLPRTAGGHLLLPILAFPGRNQFVQRYLAADSQEHLPDSQVHQVSETHHEPSDSSDLQPRGGHNIEGH